SDCVRHAQALWSLRPRNARTDLVAARLHPDRRTAVVDDDRGLSVQANLLRPVIGIARERQPRFRIDLPALDQLRAIAVGNDAQHARPRAQEIFRTVAGRTDDERARSVFLV